MVKVFTVVPGLTRRIGPWGSEGMFAIATNDHPAVVPDFVADDLEADQAARPAGKLKVSIDGEEQEVDDPARPARPANPIYRVERDAQPKAPPPEAPKPAAPKPAPKPVKE